MNVGIHQKTDRVLLGSGLALLAVFSVAVVWLYFGEGNPITDCIVVLFGTFSLIALVQRWRGRIRLGYGLRGGAPREILAGFGICTLAMAGIFCAEWSLGGIRVEGIRPEIGVVAANFGFLVLLWAPFEETLRALMLNGMRVVFRRAWIAVAMVSVAFGLIHAANDHATALSVASNALGGLMYALAFVRTGRIWMPIGLHAAWNFVQGSLLGFPVSGATDWSQGLIRQTEAGIDLITGGAFGPEGGLVGIAFRFAVIALVIIATRPSVAQTAEPHYGHVVVGPLGTATEPHGAKDGAPC
jgi:membrane protease YdiL (CAAX protease family)